MGRRTLALLVAFIVIHLTGIARATDEAPLRRLVIYVEATNVDPATVRGRLRDAIPERVLPVDSVDFKAALLRHGHQGAIRPYLGSATDRNLLFQRMRESAAEINAEGVVYVLFNENPRRRLARIIVLFVDSDTPAMDDVVVMDPATANTDAAKFATALARPLERFTKPPPAAAPAPAETAPAPPLDLERAPLVKPPPESPRASPAPRPASPPARAGPRAEGAVALELFPAGLAPNYVHGRARIPVSERFAVIPHVGAGYLPQPADDVAMVFGGGLRFRTGPLTLEPSGLYGRFPKFVSWYQGALRIGVAFGDRRGRPSFKARLDGSVTRWLWRRGLGAPHSELVEVFAHLETEIRVGAGFVFSPGGGYFVYDRSLVRSGPAINAVTFSLAPYPVQAFAGSFIGYELGRWTPYAGGRYLFYAGGVGSGFYAGPGLRLDLGGDFVDARVGLFVTNSVGPLANPALDRVPLVNLDMGWTF